MIFSSLSYTIDDDRQSEPSVEARMRADMSKVIVERPRFGGGYEPKGRRFANCLHRDPDDIDAPTKAPLRDRNRRSKSLNENLRPLVRYLLRQVGRPWDKVRSEMSAHIAPASAVQKHILDHVRDYVETNAVIVDGVPHAIGSWGPDYRAIAKHSATRLYVCPKSGLLKRAKPLRERSPEPLQVKRLRHDLAAVYLRNCWHEVSLKPAFNFGSSTYARPTTLRGSYISDAVLGDVWSLSQLDAVWGKAQGRSWYAVSMRPMARAEIRMLP